MNISNINANQIGIGTSSTDSLLHVVGSTSGTGTEPNPIVHIKQNTAWNGRTWALYVEGYSYLNGFRVNASDPERSLYKISSGQFGFATVDDSPITFSQYDDVRRMTIGSTGNVGIGTSGPNYKLDVAGDINFTGTLYQNGSAFSGGGGSSQWTTTGSNIYYSSGNVGIGTSTISYPLDVRSTANNTARISYSGASTYPYGLTLGYSSSLPSYSSQTNNLSSISVIDSSIGTGYNDGDLIISSTPLGSSGMMQESRTDIRFITNTTSMTGGNSIEAMRISSMLSDFGGIGINVPVDQTLKSAITTHFTNNNSIYASGTEYHHICMESTQPDPNDRSYFWMGYDGNLSTAYINTMQLNGAYGSYATSNLSLQTYTYSSGYVGIGTAEPKAKLHVNGTGDSGTSLASAIRKYFNYDSSSGLGSNTETEPFNWISIYGTHRIVSSDYIVSHGTTNYSDARIKKDIVDVEDDSALQTVRLLKPKKYSYIDTISKGTTPVWGFIAQEVAEVLDYSVEKMEKAIPNVYCTAVVVGEDYNILEFSNFDTGNLQYVDGTLMKKLQCKLWDNTELDIEIAEIVSSSKIRATKPLEKSKCNDKEDQSGSVVDTVFVYGQYVNDFNVLKKDAVFTVAVAALQEIDRRQVEDNESLIALENEMTALRSENTQLINQLKDITARLTKAGI